VKLDLAPSKSNYVVSSWAFQREVLLIDLFGSATAAAIASAGELWDIIANDAN
jgi:hypothetical protein